MMEILLLEVVIGSRGESENMEISGCGRTFGLKLHGKVLNSFWRVYCGVLPTTMALIAK